MMLVSWNLQWCRGMDGAVDLPRIAETLRALGRPDIVCLQEVADGFDTLPGAPAGNQAAQLAAALPGYASLEGWAVDVAGAGGTRRRFGNLILARHPVRRVLRHALPWPPDAAAPSMPRVALEAVVDTPLGALRVTTTHLEYYSGRQRAAQVERLRALHAEACAHAREGLAPGGSSAAFAPEARPAAAILTGDFNLPAGDALHRRLLEPFEDGAPALVDAWQAVHPGRAHVPTFKLHDAAFEGTPYCCDFVLLTGDLAARLVDLRVDADCVASDHQPVIATFA